MALFKAFSPDVEVNGETVQAIVSGMLHKGKAMEILRSKGIDDPGPGKWFKQQAWLDAFKIISESLGPATLFVIGQKIPENARFPPQIDTLEKALASIDVAYHMNHRGGDIGCYMTEVLTPMTIKVVCRNPYPCDFDRGIIEAMARRFKPAGTLVRIDHDSATCRSTGANECAYKVTKLKLNG